MINKRIQRLREQMRERRMDAYLIPTSDFHQSEYVGEYFKCRQFITGFTGTAGTALVTMDQAFLWTDGRYFVQAEKQLSGTEVKLCRMGDPGVPTIEEFLREALPQDGVLGVDGRTISCEFGETLTTFLHAKNISLACKEDLVGLLWEDRPALSAEPVWILEDKYSGVTSPEKIKMLRRDMRHAGADAHILTTLDEIAWLLNVRGNDIPCTPVFLSSALITETECKLFIQNAAVPEPVRTYLDGIGVTLLPYDSIYGEIQKLEHLSLLLEKAKVNYRLVSALSPTVRVIDQMNPCVMRKVVKNPVEIENVRRVHLRDGLAVTRFMHWLKCSVGEIPLSELSVAQKLEEFRKEQDGYIEPSFVTIAAYGDNAAMCHYRANEEQNRGILPQGLLLIDSGGQYLGGTTDITRTFAMGPLTDREREYFTIVSMAMLKVMDMKFLHGCRGINLDYTIREAFWKRGLDFNHGTGHGVGYLSGCHERPNGIRWKVVPERQDSAVIEPGMICSDEPGLYIEGAFGVRTENMILCVPDEKNQYGQFLRFEFLTWAPIDLDAIDTRFMDENDIRRLNTYHGMVYDKLSPLLSDEEKKWLAHATREVHR